MTYLFHVDPPSVADSGDELSIQGRLRARCKMLAPTMRLVATPNAGKRTAWAAMKAQKEGLSSGFPDLIAIASPQLTAFIELKTKTGALSQEQISWMNYLHQAGFPCGVFRSVDSAISFLRLAGFPFIEMEADRAA